MTPLLSALLAGVGKALPAIGSALAGGARWVWTNRRWTFPVLLPALALVVVLAWWAWHEHARAVQAEQDLRAQVQRERREDELSRKGYTLLARARLQADVEADKDRLAGENADLAAQLKASDAELGKTRTLLVAALRGKPAPVVTPRPDKPGDEQKPPVLRQGDEVELGADLVVREEKAGAGFLEGNLFGIRKLDGAKIVQPFSKATTWATAPAAVCPAAPPPPQTSVYGLAGGTANSAGATYQGGAQVTHKRWAAAAAVGPDPAGKGVAITVLGGFRFSSF